MSIYIGKRHDCCNIVRHWYDGETVQSAATQSLWQQRRMCTWWLKLLHNNNRAVYKLSDQHNKREEICQYFRGKYQTLSQDQVQFPKTVQMSWHTANWQNLQHRIPYNTQHGQNAVKLNKRVTQKNTPGLQNHKGVPSQPNVKYTIVVLNQPNAACEKTGSFKMPGGASAEGTMLVSHSVKEGKS